MAEYGKWTVFKLKNELRERGAVTTGRKKDLIERLESYDRNCNFTGPSVVLPTAVITDWPSCGFRQLTTNSRDELPPVTRNLIDGYFLLRVACDQQQTGDLQALRKGQLLVDSKRIEACSMLAPADGGHVFFTGIIKAAMKRKVSYNVKLKFDKPTGDILNSDCECPAGKGPHGTCKHVAAMLLMLSTFCSSGTLICRKSCTDTLQTFHQPKQLYDGSPVKVTSVQKRKRPVGADDDDPRPAHFRKTQGYNAYVSNLVTDYCAHTSKDLAFRYLLPRADIQAAILDHDYTELPFAEYWVDHANHVTIDEVTAIEKKTRGQSQSSSWFMERSWRLTASKFGDILKATARRNMSKLCKDIVEPRTLNHPAVLHGIKYEKAAVKEFTARTGMEVKSCGLFVSEQHSYLAATPDGLVGEDHIVEVKCPYRGSGKKIVADRCFPFLYLNPDGQLHLKENSKYFLQVQGQLGVTNRKSCYFVVYTVADLFVEEIAFEKDYWMTCMIPRLQLFYEKYLRRYIVDHM